MSCHYAECRYLKCRSTLALRLPPSQPQIEEKKRRKCGFAFSKFPNLVDLSGLNLINLNRMKKQDKYDKKHN